MFSKAAPTILAALLFISPTVLAQEVDPVQETCDDLMAFTTHR